VSDLRRNFFRNLRTRSGNLIEIPLPRSYLAGFGLTNDGSDGDHDIQVGAGQCKDSTQAFNIEQTATDPFIKQLDQPWAAGSAAGGLGTNQIDGAQTVTFTDGGGGADTLDIDAGTWAVTPEGGDTIIINGSGSGNDGTYQVVSSTTTVITFATGTWAAGEATSAATVHLIGDSDTYHVHAIRADDSPGSAVDFGFDTSATAANLLTNASYTYYRRIGSVLTDASANIVAFRQDGDVFKLAVALQDIASATTGTGVVTHTLASIPTGIRVEALISVQADFSSGLTFHKLGHGDIATLATPSDTDKDLATDPSGTATIGFWSGPLLTNTSAQVKSISNVEADNFTIQTRGWIDRRGKDD